MMVQQCAWCLRLINNMGEHLSALPVPKMYEASHGMCRACGERWLATAEGFYGGTLVVTQSENGRHYVQCFEENVLYQ